MDGIPPPEPSSEASSGARAQEPGSEAGSGARPRSKSQAETGWDQSSRPSPLREIGFLVLDEAALRDSRLRNVGARSGPKPPPAQERERILGGAQEKSQERSSGEQPRSSSGAAQKQPRSAQEQRRTRAASRTTPGAAQEQPRSSPGAGPKQPRSASEQLRVAQPRAAQKQIWSQETKAQGQEPGTSDFN